MPHAQSTVQLLRVPAQREKKTERTSSLLGVMRALLAVACATLLATLLPVADGRVYDLKVRRASTPPTPSHMIRCPSTPTGSPVITHSRAAC